MSFVSKNSKLIRTLLGTLVLCVVFKVAHVDHGIAMIDAVQIVVMAGGGGFFIGLEL